MNPPDRNKDFFAYLGEGGSTFDKWFARIAGFTGAAAVLIKMVAGPQSDLTWIVFVYYACFFVCLFGMLYVGIKSVGRGFGKSSFAGSLLLVLKKVFLYLLLPAFALTIISLVVAWCIAALRP